MRSMLQMIRRQTRAWPLGIALVLALSAFRDASAATHYLSPTGSDTNPGTAAAPWRTLAKANAMLVPNDVCILMPGTYPGAIDPSRNGVPGGRITYLGDIADPRQVIITGDIHVDQAYISVKGITTTGAAEMFYDNENSKAVFDSIAYCEIGNGISFEGAKRCVIAKSTIHGVVAFLMNDYLPLPPAISNSDSDTLRGNVIDIGVIKYKGFQVRGFTQNCVIDSNRISARFEVARGSDLQGRYIYNSYHNTFRDNSWTFEADANLPEGQYVAFAMRDSSSDNLFERDSMLCGVQSGVDIGGRLCNTGNAPWVGQVMRNRWSGCVYRTTGTVYTQESFKSSILENCVFVSSHSYALYALASWSNSTVRNCTFYSKASAAIRFEGSLSPGGNNFHSNIFAAEAVAPCASKRPILYYATVAGLVQDDNLFYAKTALSGATPENQSIYWNGSNCSAPGAGKQWANQTGNDTRSAYGSPRFADDRFATFDAHILSGSAAIGRGKNGVDAGAYPFLAGGPPAAVADLGTAEVFDNSVILDWTAPGADGASGTASSYDLRISTTAITAANFDAAPRFATLPDPLPAGSHQEVTIPDLVPSNTYYIALKTRDADGNWSTISNVVRLTTKLNDDRPPASITDLDTHP